MRRSVPRTGSTACRPTRGRRAGIACCVGVAMAEEGQRLFGGVLPLDDVGSGDIDLAGRFAEFLERLHAIVDAFAEPMPLDAWAAAIAEAADSLTAAPAGRRGSASSSAACSRTSSPRARPRGAVTQTALALPEIRALLADRLRGRPTRASFRTGHLTICTLVPMRSVPHRVVCLMGLDDGVFPRQTARDGDDLLLLDPHVGDRDARSEDRQLLLDAVLAATDHLVITYAARDERTNLRRPPAVPLGELLDVVDRTARFPDVATTRERVIVEHPLQPFDLRNFDAGALVPERTWSFDRIALDGARALAGGQLGAPPFLAGPLPPRGGGGDRARPARQVRPAPGAGVPSPAARHRRHRARRRPGRRAVDRARRARAVERRGAAARGPARGCRQGRRDRGRDRSRGAAAGPAGGAGARGRLSGRRAARRGGGGLRSGRRGERLRRREGGATGRSHAGRDGARRPRRPRRRLDLLAGRAEAPADRVGLPARARRRAPGDGLRGGHARPAPSGRAEAGAR